MDIKSKCASCEIQGYCPELCKAHIRKLATGKQDKSECTRYSPSLMKYGKTAAVGAGVGLAVATGSMAAIPSVTLKTLFAHVTAHVAAVKAGAGAGGGITGAGINIFRQKRREQPKPAKKRRHLYYPLVLNGGTANDK
ncbi:conserved hypothetical protein [Desulfamplus magnetovallimortis]|uniref:Uncharacterized protein n=1 Tax=Desulfamplus magnetovallimortis TaxID=1246637 RepID=L0R473_9BACT|nr:hypothetical protein [Desulfamplus magnetovallimortis]CCO06689.1 conserved hypothetical protein [Desulfamplus magnetovallimortis BW-1]SLM32740.1 conserved hypothetical protein [Desulfamplus magnetovallimortis]